MTTLSIEYMGGWVMSRADGLDEALCRMNLYLSIHFGADDTRWWPISLLPLLFSGISSILIIAKPRLTMIFYLRIFCRRDDFQS